MTGLQKTIRVSLLGREYTLRVKEENEGLTRELAQYVDGKLRAFREAHPEQSETTAAIITALAVAEELFLQRASSPAIAERNVDAEIDELERILADALTARS